MFMKKLFLVCALFSLFGAVECTAASAVNAKDAPGLAPFPIDELMISDSIKKATDQNVKKEQQSGMTEAERQMLKNANREAILKNWKRDINASTGGVNAKYEHVTGSKAVVLLYKSNPEHLTLEQIMKKYAGIYEISEQNIRVKSDSLYSLLIEMKQEPAEDKKPAEQKPSEQKPEEQKSSEQKPGKMMLYVFKEKDQNDYTAIYVLGKTTQQDLEYIVEDFFLELSK
jgi:hypothetical protein